MSPRNRTGRPARCRARGGTLRAFLSGPLLLAGQLEVPGGGGVEGTFVRRARVSTARRVAGSVALMNYTPIHSLAGGGKQYECWACHLRSSILQPGSPDSLQKIKRWEPMNGARMFCCRCAPAARSAARSGILVDPN
jgi:hypothetical protein